MSSYRLIGLLVALISLDMVAQVPIYDEAKHYQLRSMETGPWEFSPRSWYYSWWSKDMKVLWWKWSQKLPGLGIHDNGPAGLGGADHYVSRYSPNQTRRVLMLAQAKMVKKQTQKVEDRIKEVQKRETVSIADRSLDVVWEDYTPSFAKLEIIYTRRLREYRKAFGRNEAYRAIQLEHQKIYDAVNYMRKNYVTNIDRKKVYSQQLNKFEQLIQKMNLSIKMHLSYQELKSICKTS